MSWYNENGLNEHHLDQNHKILTTKDLPISTPLWRSLKSWLKNQQFILGVRQACKNLQRMLRTLHKACT